MRRARALFFVKVLELFDRHIFEFAGFEDFAALLAFDIFGVFVARYNLHPGVLALVGADFLRRSSSDGVHKLQALILTAGRVDIDRRKMAVF